MIRKGGKSGGSKRWLKDGYGITRTYIGGAHAKNRGGQGLPERDASCELTKHMSGLTKRF